MTSSRRGGPTEVGQGRTCARERLRPGCGGHPFQLTAPGTKEDLSRPEVDEAAFAVDVAKQAGARALRELFADVEEG